LKGSTLTNAIYNTLTSSKGSALIATTYSDRAKAYIAKFSSIKI